MEVQSEQFSTMISQLDEPSEPVTQMMRQPDAPVQAASMHAASMHDMPMQEPVRQQYYPPAEPQWQPQPQQQPALRAESGSWSVSGVVSLLTNPVVLKAFAVAFVTAFVVILFPVEDSLLMHVPSLASIPNSSIAIKAFIVAAVITGVRPPCM